MENLFLPLDAEKIKEIEERNVKVLKLIKEIETNFIDTRRELYKLLDQKFKPQIVDVTFTDGFGTVNILDKFDSDSFTLDHVDKEKMLEKIGEIINSKVDIDETQDNITGGQIYKYRHGTGMMRKFGMGIKEYEKY